MRATIPPKAIENNDMVFLITLSLMGLTFFTEDYWP